MDDQQMRAIIRVVYDTDTWREKVDNMSTGQVVAIYKKFKSEGKVS